MWVPFVLFLFSIMFWWCSYNILFVIIVALIVMANAKCDGIVDFHVDNEILSNGTTRLFKPLKNGRFVVGCTRCMGRNPPIWFDATKKNEKRIANCPDNAKRGVCTVIKDLTLDLVFSMAITGQYNCGSSTNQETINIQVFGELFYVSD